MLARRVLISCLLANALEWMSFVLFVYTFPQIAQVFFPATQNHALAVSNTFGLFAVGFFARPLGSMVLGFWSDQKGRRHVLRFSCVALTVLTFAMVILPGYDSWGGLRDSLSAAVAFV